MKMKKLISTVLIAACLALPMTPVSAAGSVMIPVIENGNVPQSMTTVKAEAQCAVLPNCPATYINAVYKQYVTGINCFPPYYNHYQVINGYAYYGTLTYKCHIISGCTYQIVYTGTLRLVN
jgi:hypothetical protein